MKRRRPQFARSRILDGYCSQGVKTEKKIAGDHHTLRGASLTRPRRVSRAPPRRTSALGCTWLLTAARYNDRFADVLKRMFDCGVNCSSESSPIRCSLMDSTLELGRVTPRQCNRPTRRTVRWLILRRERKTATSRRASDISVVLTHTEDRPVRRQLFCLYDFNSAVRPVSAVRVLQKPLSAERVFGFVSLSFEAPREEGGT